MKTMTPRETFFELIVNSSFEDIKANFAISNILETTQKYNLLCSNEVSYFNKKEFQQKAPEDFFNDIQNRMLFHRSEEIKINNSTVKKGGFLSVANGSRIQGTTHVKGLQPNYIVDSSSDEIKFFIKDTKTLIKPNQSIWEKIDLVGKNLREKYIKKTEYTDPVYLELLTKYREQDLEIPLSEYLKVKRGVCRESALLTILALNALGVESYYYYAKVKTIFNGIEKEEDHAVVVAPIDGEFWTIDNYFRMFNKQKLEDLQSTCGAKCKSGLMYENESVTGVSSIFLSRLYPEARHNPIHLK